MTEETQPGGDIAAPANTPAPNATDETTTQTSAPADTSAEDSAPSDTADDAANDAPKAAKHKGGFQKRIAELTRDREDAKRERDYWRQMAVEGKTPPQPDAVQKPTQSQSPRQEDFQTYDEFVAAKARYEVRQEFEQERSRDSQRQEQQRAQDARKTFDARLEQSKERYVNAEEVFESVLSDPDFPISQPMADTIMESDKGPDLVYWLGTHSDEAQRISRLSPLAAARELGRIEAQLSSPAKRNVSQAPNPPPALRGGDTPSKDPSKMSTAEYVAWRKAGGGGGKAA